MTEQPIWEPTAQTLAGSPMESYLAFLADRGVEVDGYAALHHWSVEHLEDFWASIWDFHGLDDVAAVTTYDEVLVEQTMPGARWFTGARLNFAERCLAGGDPDDVALLACEETLEDRVVTYGELTTLVARCARALRDLGLGPGDHVAGYLSNRLETVVAMLGTVAVGAVWTCAAPEFGTPSVVDRFAQVRPRLLVAVDGYRFAGREHDRCAEVEAVAAALPSLETVVTVPVLGCGPPALPDGVSHVGWDALVGGTAESEHETPEAPEFADTDFSDPLWVLWSSGTTGRPKGIVHSHGGVTLELLKALRLGCDLRRDDTYFQHTSSGWMMWNWLVGSLLTGCQVVLYDGSPTYPDVDRVWTVAERYAATVVGVGAAYLTHGHRAGSVPGTSHDLGRLRSVLQTGSTLPDEDWRWVVEVVRPGVWLQSITGGTDVCSLLAGSSPLLPVYVGRIAAPALGVDLQAWTPDGEPVTGEEAELVVTRPMPSMPLRLVEDPDGRRYRDSYFDVFPGVWRHGDWVVVGEDGTVTVAGRSDSTLNRGGVRLGSAELYGVLDHLPGVADSLVIGVEQPGGGYWMPLYVVPADGAPLDEALRDRIRRVLRTELSPRHVPDDVIAVPAVPRTLSGKRLEVPVKRILQGRAVDEAGRGAVDHPEMLDWFAEHARERRDG